MKAQQSDTFTYDPSRLPVPVPARAPFSPDVTTCAAGAWPCACSFDRRRKAAGIGVGLPQDVDERHRLVFRLICMCIDEWRGCRERPCRRHRGCMAPSGACANAPQNSPEENEVKFERASRHVYLTLRAEKAADPERFPT